MYKNSLINPTDGYNQILPVDQSFILNCIHSPYSSHYTPFLLPIRASISTRSRIVPLSLHASYLHLYMRLTFSCPHLIFLFIHPTHLRQIFIIKWDIRIEHLIFHSFIYLYHESLTSCLLTIRWFAQAIRTGLHWYFYF